MNTKPEDSAPHIAELAYLEAHGEDVGSLRSELESMLPSNRIEPSTTTPSEPALTSPDPDYRLPIARDGTEVKLDPLPRPTEMKPDAQQQQPQQRVTQEQALDPLSPDAPKTALDTSLDTTDVEPGEVVVDQDGKIRDARTGKYVPHAALHAERTKRKELEAKTTSQQELLARAQERLSVLTEIIQGQDQLKNGQQKAQEPQPEAEINPEVDVFASVAQLQKRDAERSARMAEIERAAHQRIDALQQEALYRQDALNFSLKQPDFPEAYRFFNERRRGELQILGLKDEQAIDRQLMTEERALMALGLREQRSPADIIYQMAKNRGYAQKQPDPAPAPVVQAAPAPQAVQPSVPRVAPDAAQKVQYQQNGINASATLSGAGGHSGDGLTVQQLADMSEEDFSQFVGKLGMKKLDRLLGGRN